MSKWQLNFITIGDCQHSYLGQVPIVPIEIFTGDALMRLGNTIGRAIHDDHTFGDAARGRFAQVYVELD